MNPNRTSPFIALFFATTTLVFGQKSNATLSDLAHQKDALEWYIHLHQQPELSTQETATAAYLKNKLSAMGYTIVDSLGYHSFAAILRNGKGSTLLYRTDMDGLPVKEATGLAIASTQTVLKDNVQTPVMHACGHDIHMSTWLNVARTMIAQKKQWKGTLVLVAQSAEEVGKGAKGLFASKAWRLIPTPDKQLAFHNNASLEVGQLGFCDGYAMAAVDMMNITLYGKGGHGAEPQKAIDPILLSAQYITEIQTIVSRNLPPSDPAVITVGAINGGSVGNVIPSEVTLKLTIRSYSPESRALILQRLKTIGDQLALAAGMESSQLPKYDLLDMSIPPVFNSVPLGASLKKVLGAHFDLVPVVPTMIGEDFGIYSKQNTIPSYLIWLGVLSKSQKEAYLKDSLGIPSLHSARFAPDYENAIPVATEAMATALLYLFQNQ
jgi:hippurate hydrolase